MDERRHNMDGALFVDEEPNDGPSERTRAPRRSYNDGKAEAAQRITQGILDRMDLEATARVREDDERVVLDIEGPDAGRAIGKKGMTLEALQFLVNKIVNRDPDERRHIVLDSGDYRERHDQGLVSMAKREAKRALNSGRAVTLEPMSARDRRVIHVSLAKFPGVSTRSEGEGMERRLQIIPVRSGRDGRGREGRRDDRDDRPRDDRADSERGRSDRGRDERTNGRDDRREPRGRDDRPRDDRDRPASRDDRPARDDRDRSSARDERPAREDRDRASARDERPAREDRDRSSARDERPAREDRDRSSARDERPVREERSSPFRDERAREERSSPLRDDRGRDERSSVLRDERAREERSSPFRDDRARETRTRERPAESASRRDDDSRGYRGPRDDD